MALRKIDSDELAEKLSPVLVQSVKDTGGGAGELMEAVAMFSAVLAVVESLGFVLATDAEPEQG